LGSMRIGIGLPEAHREENRRIHSSRGPAIVWGDSRQWWWRGVRVEQAWIEDPESVDPKIFWEEENEERRRALAEILGWERILDSGDSRVIQTDETGQLVEADLEDDEGGKAKFCDVRCPSTGRRYLLRVPPTTESCREGVAWTFDLPSHEWNPLHQT
jgi:hypothetical protein